MSPDDQLELLRSIVALRIEQRTVPELVRQTLVAVERRLLAVLPELIRKRIAAELLGISVQALDRWIGCGELEAAPIPGTASRHAVVRSALLELAVEAEVARRGAAPGARIIRIAATERARRIRLTRDLHSTHNLIADSHVLMAAARAKRSAS